MASKQDGAQPEVIWLRSETLGEEKAFSPTHAARLQALEASQGKPDWLPIAPPAPPSPTLPTPNPADDPQPRKRTGSTRKPRQRRGD